jgi:DNA-binding transcriptional LysR family regulator
MIFSELIVQSLRTMRTPNLSTELLRTFVTVVDLDGFNIAARRLHKTQSTVSQQIRRLEQELGHRLFAAQGRKRRLTAAGERFVGHARRLLSMQEAAVAALGEGAIEGELRLGVAQGLSEGPFPELMARFARDYPRVRLHVHTGFTRDLAAGFAGGDYDLMLIVRRSGAGAESAPVAGLGGGRVLGQARLRWIGADGVEQSLLDQDAPLPLATFAPPCTFRQTAVDALNGAGIPWRVAYTTTSLPGLMAAVKNGLGVTARTEHALVPGTRVLAAAHGLPELSPVDVVLHHARRSRIGDLLEQLFVETPPRAA